MQQLNKHCPEIEILSIYTERMHKPLVWLGILQIVFLLLFGILLLMLQSCKKLVEISPPSSTIVSSAVFATDEVATQAMSGVYYYMINSISTDFSRGGITIYTGLSSDELILYNLSNTVALEFNQNNILPNNNQLYPQLWQSPFSTLYQTNAVLDGLQNSRTISDSVKKELTAEAKFIRAFVNFYLVNLFGAIPYVENPDWRKNNLLSRLSISDVYQKIFSDLKDAQEQLPANFDVGKGQRIIPNKFAATAMLARMYLYSREWEKAEDQATQIINSPFFALTPDLNDVFKPNNSEAIWQLQQDNTSFSFNGVGEGTTIIPRAVPVTFGPFAYLTTSLLNSFEPDDNRKAFWINSKTINNTTYFYPYKYKIGPSEAIANGSYTEYYMVLRLAEQYLIRAEARANRGNLADAVNDINVIRQRAGLSLLPNSLTQEEVTTAIEQEKRIEFLCEWGHRWLDLKRWGKADTVLEAIKGSDWRSTDQLYPIPLNELTVDPNLTQNPGYN